MSSLVIKRGYVACVLSWEVRSYQWAIDQSDAIFITICFSEMPTYIALFLRMFMMKLLIDKRNHYSLLGLLMWYFLYWFNMKGRYSNQYCHEHKSKFAR